MFGWFQTRAAQAALRTPRPAAWLPVVILALAACAYAPSLAGGWVWDDHFQMAANAAFEDPIRLLTEDVWSPTGQGASHLYRPLAMLTHLPGQRLWPGPTSERVASLLLHLAAVALVAGIARRIGASREGAWFAAALFGTHAAVSEAVAWPSARTDLMGTVLLLAMSCSLLAKRDRLAGVAAALAPFAKEPLVLAPVCALIWMTGMRRFAPWTLGLAAAGGGAYALARKLAGVPFPSASAPLADSIAGVGGVTRRGLELLVVPGSADALSVHEPSVWIGVLALLVGAAAFSLLLGAPSSGRVARVRLPLTALLAPLPVLAAAVPAAVQSGLVADRYYHAALPGVFIAAGFACGLLFERVAVSRLLWLAVPVLALGTAVRALEWRDDAALFQASLRRDPANPYAAFHVANHLHQRLGDCEAAVPLYRRAQRAERRAGVNLQACLLVLGRGAEAAELGPALIASDPSDGLAYENTAWAHNQLREPLAGERFAREALRLAPRRAMSWIVLGEALGQQGRHAEAARAFERALALDPGAASAARGAAKSRALARTAP